MSSDYKRKLQQQIEQYRGVDINELPKIFHYWSHKYVRAILEEVFGLGSFSEIYAELFERCFSRTGIRRAISLGPGDGWLEVEIASTLRLRGQRDFQIECVEVSDHLIERGIRRAIDAGVYEHVVFRQADLNDWQADRRVGAYLASQSLHHFVNLESIFDNVAGTLDPNGVFASNDTIGRNGHMRWPETRAIVDYFWQALSERLCYNHLLGRFEHPNYLDWDCSGDGFEGIRAQDILPALVSRFGFTHFAAWGGVIDPFVDRAFGHNYSVEDPAHLAFIDEIETTNLMLLEAGFIKPTQMCAFLVLDKSAHCRSYKGLSPSRSVRDPAKKVAQWEYSTLSAR